VGFDEDHAYFLNQAWLLQRLGGRLPRLRVNNGLVLQDAVRKGSGLGVLPCFSGDRDPVLHRLTAPLPEITRDLYLVVHREVRRAPAVRAVMDALIEIFKREAPQLMGVEAIENKRESTNSTSRSRILPLSVTALPPALPYCPQNGRENLRAAANRHLRPPFLPSIAFDPKQRTPAPTGYIALPGKFAIGCSGTRPASGLAIRAAATATREAYARG
jgi:hypothetical protein